MSERPHLSGSELRHSHAEHLDRAEREEKRLWNGRLASGRINWCIKCQVCPVNCKGCPWEAIMTSSVNPKSNHPWHENAVLAESLSFRLQIIHVIPAYISLVMYSFSTPCWTFLVNWKSRQNGLGGWVESGGNKRLIGHVVRKTLTRWLYNTKYNTEQCKAQSTCL